MARQRGVCTLHGPYMTLSALLLTAQRRAMSSATMETRGSLNPLSWRQVSLLRWVVTGWGLLLLGAPRYFSETKAQSYFSPGAAFWLFVYLMAYMTA